MCCKITHYDSHTEAQISGSKESLLESPGGCGSRLIFLHSSPPTSALCSGNQFPICGQQAFSYAITTASRHAKSCKLRGSAIPSQHHYYRAPRLPCLRFPLCVHISINIQFGPARCQSSPTGMPCNIIRPACDQ